MNELDSCLKAEGSAQEEIASIIQLVKGCENLTAAANFLTSPMMQEVMQTNNSIKAFI